MDRNQNGEKNLKIRETRENTKFIEIIDEKAPKDEDQ